MNFVEQIFTAQKEDNDSCKEVIIKKVGINSLQKKVQNKVEECESEEEEEFEEECESEEEEPKPIKKIIKKTTPTYIEKTIIYEKYEENDLNQKLGKYMFGLDKVIPWEDKNFVFGGGLLYDMITNRFSEDLSDIDLFFYGSLKEKHNTINKLLDNLDINQYYYLIGYIGSVIYIFIQDVPRIIQLIMTNQNEPQQIINGFDFTHIQMYFDGNDIYYSQEANADLEFKETTIKELHKNRIIKYFERGINFTDIFSLSNKFFVLSNYDKEKLLKSKMQKSLYKITYNLSKYPNSVDTIDFNNFDKEQIDLHDIFGCKVNYEKVNNHDFKENINMFGLFAGYFHQKSEDILGKKLDLNEGIELNLKQPESKFVIESYKLTCENSLVGWDKLVFENVRSVYVPCKFIKSEEIINKSENNLKILKIFFEIENCSVISFLKQQLNKFIILKNINFGKYGTKNLIESKYDFLEKKNVYSSIIENQIESDENKMLICSKLFNEQIEYFFKLNGKDIFNTLNKENEIYCLFDINIFIKKVNPTTLKYIDINLSPIYIFSKHN